MIRCLRRAGAVSSLQSGGFSAAAAQSSPAFGSGGVFAPPAAAAAPAPAPSLFSASPAFGASPTQTSPFGQPAAIGGFGPATPGSTGAFGSMGGFGQAAVMGGAAFGQAATPGSGQQPAAGAFGAAPFGSPASPNLQQPSPGNHSPYMRFLITSPAHANELVIRRPAERSTPVHRRLWQLWDAQQSAGRFWLRGVRQPGRRVCRGG